MSEEHWALSPATLLGAVHTGHWVRRSPGDSVRPASTNRRCLGEVVLVRQAKRTHTSYTVSKKIVSYSSIFG